MTEITAQHGLFGSTDLHVDDYGGNGRPVVLIHGWPLSGESWGENVPALQQAGYRVVTYDRRGFGRSDQPRKGYDYDTLTEDLHTLLTELDLQDVTLVGFSMGGGEVARYFSKYGAERIRSVVFAAAVPPYLLKGDDNPEGPLEESQAAEWTAQVTKDQHGFFEGFTKDFYSVDGQLVVSEATRQEALALSDQAKKQAVLGCMEAFGTTDFRDDLTKITVPALVIHGDGDAVVPFEGSGQRTHEALASSELHLVKGGPHGINVSHAGEFNSAVIDFLER